MKRILMTIAIAGSILITGKMQGQTKDEGQTKDSVQSSMSMNTVQQEYKQVKINEIPKAVTQTVQEDYRGSTVFKAYKNEQNEYKLILTAKGAEEGEHQTVYITQDGNWMKMKKKK